MRQFLRSAALLGVLAVGFPAMAWADGFKYYKVCGGNTFATCAAVSITVVGQDVTVRVWNLSGNAGATYGTNTYAGTIFNGIGFYNTGGVTAVSGTLQTSGPAAAGPTPGNWGITNSGKVGFTVDFRTITPNTSPRNGIASGCAQPGQLPSGTPLYQNPCTSGLGNPGDWVTFTFKVSGTWDPSTSDIIFRGINGPNGGAVECWTGDTRAGVANCTTVTPEPVSMALLATGLAGMGGVGFYRRRKQNKAS